MVSSLKMRTFSPMKRIAAKNIAIFAGLGLFSYSLIVNYTDFSPSIAGIIYSRGALVYTIIAFCLVGGSTQMLSGWVNSRYFHHAIGRRQVYVAHTLVALLLLLINYSLFVVAKALADVTPIYSFSRSGWYLLLMVWMAEMTIVGLLLSNSALHANQQLRQEADRLQIENTQARYAALQSQLNPHFLFNSLNTLVAEIKYHPDTAVSFTRHLSSVYRYVLQCHDRQVATLGEELDFLESYLFLHRVRLGDCIVCDVAIEPAQRERQLPPLTLQVLVENVIKHNSVSLTRPMTIHLSCTADGIVVSNPIAPKKRQLPSAGVGLRNLANRCRLLTGRDIVVSDDDQQFTVHIPTLQ